MKIYAHKSKSGYNGHKGHCLFSVNPPVGEEFFLMTCGENSNSVRLIKTMLSRFKEDPTSDSFRQDIYEPILSLNLASEDVKWMKDDIVELTSNDGFKALSKMFSVDDNNYTFHQLIKFFNEADAEQVSKTILNMDFIKVAVVFSKMDADKAAAILVKIDVGAVAGIMETMNADIAAGIMETMNADVAAGIMEAMNADTAAVILEEMPFRTKFGIFIGQPKIHKEESSFKQFKNLIEISKESEYKMLNFKGQVVLQGPPGTGKSYRAKQISRALTGQVDDSKENDKKNLNWQMVQFHPSYNYEDFVRGIQVSTQGRSGVRYSKGSIRGKSSESNIEYKTVNRIFAKMCKSAEANPTEPYVLIIDEMNRANLPSVLGELIYGLEYRGEEVQTPYEVNSSKGLTVPENLFVIGTMNTADRSIGHIDYAIRRRFAFIDVLPSEDTVKDHYEGGSGLRDKAQGYFNAVGCLFENSLSGEYEREHVQIGHSYFMASTEDELNLKIQYEVLPILREYMQDGILDETKGSLKEHLESWDAFKQLLSPAKEDELGEGK